MKHLTRIALLTFAISGLLTAQQAYAEPTNINSSAQSKPISREPKKCDRWEQKNQQLAALKTDLKLTVNQEAAWTDWVGQIEGDHKSWEEKRKNEESWTNLPAPERMEKMLAFSKEHIARQEARLAATKTFYTLLSPEQRQTFDKGFNFEQHGRFAKHEKHQNTQ